MEIAYRILWTDFAITQLKDIYDYHLVKANQRIAQRLVQKIIDSIILLENNPRTGRKEDLLEKRTQEFRFIIIKNYKIIYWIESDFQIIHISLVFDTSQNPKAIKKLTR